MTRGSVSIATWINPQFWPEVLWTLNGTKLLVVNGPQQLRTLKYVFSMEGSQQKQNQDVDVKKHLIIVWNSTPSFDTNNPPCRDTLESKSIINKSRTTKALENPDHRCHQLFLFQYQKDKFQEASQFLGTRITNVSCFIPPNCLFFSPKKKHPNKKKTPRKIFTLPPQPEKPLGDSDPSRRPP